MIFQTGGLYRCKTGFSDLQNVATNYCVVGQTLSWDCPFNSRISNQFNLVSKALENIIRAYFTL
jgi:hypothetical protein